MEAAEPTPESGIQRVPAAAAPAALPSRIGNLFQVQDAKAQDAIIRREQLRRQNLREYVEVLVNAEAPDAADRLEESMKALKFTREDVYVHADIVQRFLEQRALISTIPDRQAEVEAAAAQRDAAQTVLEKAESVLRVASTAHAIAAGARAEITDFVQRFPILFKGDMQKPGGVALLNE